MESVIVHGTAVALAGRAVLFLGPAGCGKSGHALALMALGGRLVADDRTCVRAAGEGLFVSAPQPIAGLIEARGVGILRAEAVGEAPLALAVDLARPERMRLPQRRRWHCLSRSVPLLHKAESVILIPAIAQYLRGGGFADV